MLLGNTVRSATMVKRPRPILAKKIYHGTVYSIGITILGFSAEIFLDLSIVA